MITIEQAWSILQREIDALGTERVALRAALGRVLAEDIAADRDFPATDRSAMDGYAVRAADANPNVGLKLVGEQRAGEPRRGEPLQPGEACRIYTGAVIPPGADAVLMVERAEVQGETILVGEDVGIGDHIRRQGEERRLGDAVLHNGHPIRPAEIAALASVGCAEIPVQRKPRVAVVSTGDEIVEPHERPQPHQVRNSNGHTLMAQLDATGYEARYLGIARDDRAALRTALDQALRKEPFDVLLLTGGVSVGAYDLVAEALGGAGMERWFHGVQVKPGKPVLAGRCGETVVFGLPGNPVSTFAGFRLFVLPALCRLAGRSIWRPQEVQATLDEELRCRAGRRTYHLALLQASEGGWRGRRLSTSGSGDVLALHRANGYVITDPEVGYIPSGHRVLAMPWGEAG